MVGKRKRDSYGGIHYFTVTATLLLLLLLSVFLLYNRLSSDSSLIRDFNYNFYSDSHSHSHSHSGYYFDQASLPVRHGFHPRSLDDVDVDRWSGFHTPFLDSLANHANLDCFKVVFGSDDVPVDAEWRRKLVTVNGIEDALLLKSGVKISSLREGWGGWFDAKSEFLRKDGIFKSSFEVLNPMSNPLLQDPDDFGVTRLTRGDKLVRKGLVHEIEKASYIVKESLGFSDIKPNLVHLQANEFNSMNDTSLNKVDVRQGYIVDQETEIGQNENGTFSKMHQRVTTKKANSTEPNRSEPSGPMYAGGRRWGYFPRLHPYLSFSNFMNSFLRKSRCTMRVFMVWNSPPWMYTVRHQRGLESVLFHHPDACIVVFSETIELDFFKEFLKDGFKIAVAMPNLEELLKDTPTNIFASVWHEWRTTRFYSTHYSELVRLAALYKYGGIYLDCDIVVLKPISAFTNSLGMEEAPSSLLNGAVMAFSKHSSFIMQCMLEFYFSYDDTLLRWNGADLLTRVAGNFSNKASVLSNEPLLKVQSASIFFPISSHHIQRYFIAPMTDNEKAHQESLLSKILNESYTFHFWNSLTSALVPEPDSMVAMFLNKFCIHCFDVL